MFSSSTGTYTQGRHHIKVFPIVIYPPFPKEEKRTIPLSSVLPKFLPEEPKLTSAIPKFASYISHEISSVDKFGSSDEEDEDDDDVSFATAPSEPPPPPPLPLNIKRAQHRTQIEDAEKEAEGLENMEDLDVKSSCPVITCDFTDSRVQSSDEEDMLQGSLFRRRINSTHEAKIRELLEDEEDEFLSEGIRALDIRSPITTYESREVAPGEFYGHPRREEPAVPTSIEEKEVPLSEKVPVGEAKEDEAKGKGLPEEKA